MINVIVSLIYAPTLLLLLNLFEFRNVCITLIIFSAAWLLALLVTNKGGRDRYFPLLYLALGIAGLFFQDINLLKLLPLLLALIFTAIAFLASWRKEPFILEVARRFSRHTISSEEEAYIRQSSKFWLLLFCLNAGIHVLVLVHPNVYYWAFYTSVGWYGIFLLGALLQYLHRRYLFLRRPHG